MINPPIALYYMQGLNTTPLHGHAALFGVYGMLGIGLMLVCLRALVPNAEWNEKLAEIRLLVHEYRACSAMCILSLLPVGLLQTWASVDQGYWYARSRDFLGTPLLQTAALDARPGRHAVRHRRVHLRAVRLLYPEHAGGEGRASRSRGSQRLWRTGGQRSLTCGLPLHSGRNLRVSAHFFVSCINAATASSAAAEMQARRHLRREKLQTAGQSPLGVAPFVSAARAGKRIGRASSAPGPQCIPGSRTHPTLRRSE